MGRGKNAQMRQVSMFIVINARCCGRLRYTQVSARADREWLIVINSGHRVL